MGQVEDGEGVVSEGHVGPAGDLDGEVLGAVGGRSESDGSAHPDV